ncbi:MAG: hypothetical protein RL616_157 [Verrucomicrobiota bacterium]|jgi:hypothetical protein
MVKLAAEFNRLKPSRLILIFLAVLAVQTGIELAMGRLFFGPDGRFGLWETSIWSSENSQRVADPYSFSHIVHGISFYALLWLVARKLPVEKRLLIALALEVSWELLENSPLIINRYREATVALGYCGDSVLNSVSDGLMMTAGFLLASKVKPLVSLAAVAVMEIGCALWVRDNLTLNIIMLIHPVNVIKHWQLAGQPQP